MCGIIRAGIKPQDITVLNLFYLSFARRLCCTEETRHLSAGPENRGHFPTFLWMKGCKLQHNCRANTNTLYEGALRSQIATPGFYVLRQFRCNERM